MSEVETSIEPPDVDEDGDSGPEISVFLTLYEADGTEHAANTTVEGTADHVVAEALIRCIRGVAAMRGPGLQVAIQQAMGELP